MTKFEQIGVNRQIEASTRFQAEKSFSNSCNICCMRGMHIECDRCAIAEAHKLVMATMDDVIGSRPGIEIRIGFNSDCSIAC